MMRFGGPYWLASGSPRRRLMLSDAAVPITVQPADVDDGLLVAGRVPPEAWVMALAYLKARRVANHLIARSEASRGGTVIGADTVCVLDGRILGQPRDADHARQMLRLMRDREHATITGVALLKLAIGTPACAPMPRLLIFDRARVIVGCVSDEEIERYVSSADWQGKAGAYNLSERLDADWPIRVEGDPATVMGLPMQRLERLLGRSTEATA